MTVHWAAQRAVESFITGVMVVTYLTLSNKGQGKNILLGSCL